MTLVRFEGNCPRNVAKDAKYSIKYEAGTHVVGIVYRSMEGERWHPVSGDHPELVEIVNEVKLAATGFQGGAFYINEYKQVLVPSTGDRDYSLAGEYHKPLQFEFEGYTLSGDALDLNGQPLKPGDRWVGPHPGIRYVLVAGGRDIRYQTEPRPRVTKDVYLSDYRDQATVSRICRQIAQGKSLQGGRFYINEYCQFFAPINTGPYVDYQYIGRLESLDDWFPKPHA